MFALISGFIKYLFSKSEFQILIIGLDYAGKTTLLEQMKGYYQKTETIPLNKIPPTVGLNIGRMDIDGCRVILWDLGGQTRLRSIWDKYYSEAHGLIFVIDSADAERFQEAKDILDTMRAHPDLQDAPFLLFANKQDLQNAAKSATLSEIFQSPPDSTRESHLAPVSALTCEGLDDGMKWLLSAIKRSSRPLTRN